MTNQLKTKTQLISTSNPNISAMLEAYVKTHGQPNVIQDELFGEMTEYTMEVPVDLLTVKTVHRPSICAIGGFSKVLLFGLK